MLQQTESSKEIVLSHYQTAITDWKQNGTGSAVIEAVAGSGKSFTIFEVAKLIDESEAALYVAFNKAIADNLKLKLPKHVEARTLNSLGHQAWMRKTGARFMQVESGKTRNILKDISSYSEQEDAGSGLTKLIGLAKHVGIAPVELGVEGLFPDTPEAWSELIDRYALDIENEGLAIRIARKALLYSVRMSDNVIDFDDQVYLPVIFGAEFFQYDWVVVDEMQDCDDIQRVMLKRSLKPGGRFLGVGDRCQSLYGFRGANPESFQRFVSEFEAVQLPLSICYRCPKSVVAEAQKYVSHIEHHHEKEDGHVESLDAYETSRFKVGDAIICRTNAPIIRMAYALIRARIPCKVLGRDLATGLVSLVKKMKAKDIDSLSEKLDAFCEKEVKKALAKDDESKAMSIKDRVRTLEIFIEELTGDQTLTNLINSIQSMFSDGDKTDGVTLSTIHKAKGAEYDHVYYLEPHISFKAKKQWQRDQERNCKYVAVTRARKRLTYITLDGMVEPSKKAA